MSLPVIDLRSGGRPERLQAIMARHGVRDPLIEQRVAKILATVRQEGDAAVRRYTARFDGVELGSLRADREETAQLAARVPASLERALRGAAANIRAFHERQLPVSMTFEREPGVTLGLRADPLGAVGLYIPGGKAAYPSTVLMNAIAAQVAGVPRIVAVTPPATFRSAPVVAGVLELLGITEVYLVGGAQAVAALAFGTESIPRVDKIVGPGNAYVAEAKRQVFGQVAIDAIAGPSEIVVVAEPPADPAWIAADLLSQAEHDEAASALAIVWDEPLARAIAAECDRQLPALVRRDMAAASLAAFGAVFLVAGPTDALELIAALAPEHVEVMTADPARFAAGIRNTGAIFLGPYSAEVVGDYYAGPNHVLPTNGTARFSSPLGVYDFIKQTSVISYDAAALGRDGPAIVQLAEAEGLGAHAEAARIRLAALEQREAPGVQEAALKKREAPGVQQVAANGQAAALDRDRSPRAGSDPLALVKPGVRALAPYTLAPWRAAIKLNQNENPHDLPWALKQEVFERLRDQPWCRYPDFIPAELHDRIALYAGWRADGVLAGNGSNELISSLLSVTVAPGTLVATFDPTFSLYGLLVGINGGDLRKIPLGPDMEFRMDALEEAARNADILILCSPNNPTGRQLPERDLTAILAAARGLVVLDEAYVEFAPQDMGPLLGRFRNLVVLRTFSKALSLAGLRVGYLLGDPELCREIAKAKLPYNLNVFSLTAAQVVLERQDLLAEAIAAVKLERTRVTAELGRVAGVRALPTDANFMLVRAEVPPKAIVAGLLDRGVLVRDVSGHPRLSDCFRFNIGTAAENDRFLEALEQTLAACGPG